MSQDASSQETSSPSTKSSSSSDVSSTSESSTLQAEAPVAPVVAEPAPAVEITPEIVAAAEAAVVDGLSAYEAAVKETSPDKAAPEYLAVTHECSAPCGLTESEYFRGRMIHRCEKCGFQTFDADEAAARKPA